jgi:hypothetical protein
VIAFLVGVVTGSVCTWYLVRKRLASWRESRDWWRDVAAQRAVELKAADEAGEVADTEIGRLLEENKQLIAEANALRVAVRQGGAR